MISDLNEVTGSDVNEDVLSVVESGGNVERGGEWDKDLITGGAEGEVVEGGGSDLEASGGGANVSETILEKINFEIGLFLNCLQLLHTHPLQT